MALAHQTLEVGLGRQADAGDLRRRGVYIARDGQVNDQ
jgi:hypothetical protein